MISTPDARRLLRRLLALLPLALGAAPPALAASPAELEAAQIEGLAWLLPRQAGDGGWQSDGAPGELQATAEIVAALRNAGIEAGYGYGAAVSWLSNARVASVDGTARQIIALSAAGAEVGPLVDRLLSVQEPVTRSWGPYPGYASSLPDTPLALDAILLSGTPYGFTGNSLGWLVSQQNGDGGFPYDPALPGAPSRIVPTALSVRCLARHLRLQGWGVDAFITNAIPLLVSAQQADGSYADDPAGDATEASVLVTAMVHGALVEAQAAGNAAALAAQPTVDAIEGFLVAAQAAGGDWAGRAFPTAAVLATLPPNPLPDGDGDGIPDPVEVLVGTNPIVPDGDRLADGNGDGIPGGTEPGLFASAEVGSAFSLFLPDTGGSAPFAWSIASGRLPDGLSLDPVAGEVSGVPTVAGPFHFTFLASDADGLSLSTVARVSVAPAPAAVPALSVPGMVMAALLILLASLLTRRGGAPSRARTPVLSVVALGLLLTGVPVPGMAAAGELPPLPAEVRAAMHERFHPAPATRSFGADIEAQFDALEARLAQDPGGPVSREPQVQRMLRESQAVRFDGALAEIERRLAERQEVRRSRGLPDSPGTQAARQRLRDQVAALKGMLSIATSNPDDALAAVRAFRAANQAPPTAEFPDSTLETWTARAAGPALPPVEASAPPAYRRGASTGAPRVVIPDLRFAGGPSPAPGAAVCGFTADDLADDGRDVRLTQEILDLAADLDHNPARIFDFVARSITFEPYFGALKGSLETLRGGAGSATDQASLLISLLRASGVPARYVRGRIRLQEAAPLGPDGQAARWLGAKSSSGAAAILAQGQNPGAASITGDLGILTEHVWVEACLPYASYRGTGLDATGHRWVPLDASIEDRTYQDNVVLDVAFDYAAFLADRRQLMPEAYFADQVLAAARALDPGNTLDDVRYAGEKNLLTLDVLPVTLPYVVDVFTAWSNTGTAETAVLPDGHHYRLDVIVNGGDVNAALPYPETIDARITVAFAGATPADQTLLDAWIGDGSTGTPVPCGINVVPVLRTEGAEQARGVASVDLCSTGNGLALQVVVPEGRNGGAPVNATSFSNIAAASYYAVLAHAFQVSDALLADRTARLVDAVNGSGDINDDLEAVQGEFLHIAGLRYLRQISDAGRTIGRLRDGSGDAGHHLGVTGAQVKLDFVLGLPWSVTRSGLLIDVPGARSRNVDLTTGQLDFDTFLLAGYAASNYESYVWQENAEVDAISTVRGLQFANEEGIEVLVVDSDNWAAESPKLTSNPDPTLDYTASQVSNIFNNYVNLGFTVTLPRSQLQYGNWRGAVFVGELNQLPSSAQAAFIISGGYAGGFSVDDPPPGTDFLFDPFALPGTPGFDPFQTFGGDPVNMVNGNLWHTEIDVEIPARGDLPFIVERNYNSASPQDGDFGFGWSWSLGHRLLFLDDERDGVPDEAEDADGLTSTVVWRNGTGSERNFAGPGGPGGIAPGTTLTTPAGAFEEAAREADGTWRVLRKDGFRYRFENVPGLVGTTARLIQVVSPRGNTMDLAYGPDGLASITDGAGRSLQVTTTAGRITRLEDWTGRAWEYAYDAAGDLIEVRDPLAVAGQRNPITYDWYAATDGPGLAHRLRSFTLPRGNGMTFEYYANGKVFRHSNALGETMTFTYNDFRRESTTINERGHVRRYLFDAAGNLVRLELENGGTEVFEYDTDPARRNNRTAKTDPVGLTTRYEYDAAGNVIRIVHPSGSEQRFVDFNAFNDPQKVRNANGDWMFFKYDATGGRTDVIALRRTADLGFDPATVDAATFDPAAFADDVLAWRRYGYDAFGNLTVTQRIRDFATATGPTTTFTYDADGLYPTAVERCADRDGDGTIAAPSECDQETLVYDALGRITRGIRDDWEIVQFAYDVGDRRISVTDSQGLPRTLRYDGNDNVVGRELVVDVDGTPTLEDQYAATYDGADRLLTEVDAGGFVTRYAYDAIGNLIELTDPDDYTIRFEYDRAQHMVRTQDKAGHTLTREVDAAGRVLAVTGPEGDQTRFEYYPAARDGRLFRQYDPLGRVVEFDYDAHGNVVRTTDNLGQSELVAYDALHRMVRIVRPQFDDPDLGPVHPVTCYDYDLLGYMTRVRAGHTTVPDGSCDGTDVLSVQAIYTYDDLGRRLTETDAVGNTWHFAYDRHDNLVRLEDPKGQVVHRTYGYGGRLLAQTVEAFAGDPSPEVTTFTRNALGQATSVTTPAVSYAYQYDEAHRLVDITDQRGGKHLTYTWSPGGLLDRMEDSDGGVTRYGYDAVGRVTNILAPDGAFVGLRYDRAGRMTDKWLPNGIHARFVWNGDDTLASIENRTGGASPAVVSASSYEYDGIGRREVRTETLAGATTTVRYTYDALDRLTEVRSADGSVVLESFAYDPFGNRVRRTAGGTTQFLQYDAAHQLQTVRTGGPAGPLLLAYDYDANGNVVRRCGGTGVVEGASCSGSDILDLAYDPLNRVAAATRSGLPAESYAYDAEGRRVSLARGAATTEYVYTGPDIAATYDAAWADPQARITHGPRKDAALVRSTASGSAFYHRDGIGSAVAVSDGAGTVLGTQAYAEFGSPTATTGSGVPLYGFTGREPDATGLVYFRARYYDPQVGRFLQRDPLGFVNGVNRYAYAMNSPTNATDPNGTVVETAWDVANIGLGVYSLQDNVRSGNWGWAALDAVGLVYDGVATAVPFLPAGASAGFKAARAGNTVVDSVNVGLDVARTADIAHDAARGADTAANAATEGTRIHRQVGQALDGNLSDGANNFFSGANRATGPQPDLSWNNAPGIWADLTTPGQWQAHVNRYGGSFGEGIPLLYERGTGLVNTSRLYSGAGTGLTGLDLLFGNDPFGLGFDPWGNASLDPFAK